MIEALVQLSGKTTGNIKSNEEVEGTRVSLAYVKKFVLMYQTRITYVRTQKHI